MAPSFDRKKVEETRRLHAETSTVIEIPFQAFPMPKAIWKFKNGDLPDSRRFKVDTKKGVTTMSLSKASFIFFASDERAEHADLLSVRVGTTPLTESLSFVFQAQRSDTGVYTCEIENEHGSTKATIKVLVIGMYRFCISSAVTQGPIERTAFLQRIMPFIFLCQLSTREPLQTNPDHRKASDPLR